MSRYTEGNPYPLGSVECIAYAHGAEYAMTHQRRENPLSGEWAGDPTPADVIRAVWRELLGESWDTFTDGTENDRDDDDAISDAWEEGAREVWGEAPEPDGWVCTDCALIIASNDDSGIADPQAHRAAMTAHSTRTGIPAASWIVGDDEDSFSTAPCSACGSTLAGARLAVSILPEHV